MKPEQKNKQILFLDFETRNPVKDILKDCGTYNYAAHEQTEVLILTYRLSTWKKGRVEVWELPLCNPVPELFKKFNGLIVAHNWSFEYEIFRHKIVNLLPQKIKKHFLNPKNYFCTMGQAMRWGCPGSLEKAALFLNLKEQKLASAGNKILQTVHKMKNNMIIYLSDLPAGTWENLIVYGKQDVITTEALYNTLPPLSSYLTTEKLGGLKEEKEMKIFRLDQQINLRGFQIDTKSLEKIYSAYTKYIEEAEKKAEELAGLTSGGKLVIRSPQAFVSFINKWLRLWSRYDGFEIENAQTETITKLLENKTIPKTVKQAAELRQILSPSAPKKLKALINQTDGNGIARHQLLYYGAHTGRWSGRGIQPQNMQRDCITEKEFPKALKKFCSGKDSANSAGALIRPLITARKDHVLIIRDYAQIELRVLLWLAGHSEELRLVKDPAGDLYKHFAANNIYKIPFETVSKTQRHLGKISILGLGYGMGKIKFRATALQGGIDVKASLCDAIVKSYRKRFNRVTVFWKEVERAFISSASTSVNLGGVGIQFYSKGRSRRILLPSGRELNYFKVQYKKTDEGQRITYEGRRALVYVWGGVIVENIVQAISRDILAEGLLSCLKIPGVDPILTIHDEIVFEMLKSKNPEQARKRNIVDRIDKILNKGPEWAAGLPLEVEGPTGVKRYGK